MKQQRITRAALFMGTASLFAQRATCNRLKVGCIITSADHRIISSGYNGAPKGLPHCDCSEEKPCTAAIHAEANAIAWAARNGVGLLGSTMYCTHTPCIKCSELIIQAGIWLVVYGDEYRLTEGKQLLSRGNVITAHYNPNGWDDNYLSPEYWKRYYEFTAQTPLDYTKISQK